MSQSHKSQSSQYSMLARATRYSSLPEPLRGGVAAPGAGGALARDPLPQAPSVSGASEIQRGAPASERLRKRVEPLLQRRQPLLELAARVHPEAVRAPALGAVPLGDEHELERRAVGHLE